ncbi:hypothetical protein CA599_31310 [Paenibacillus taichungensis]|nr:hypothetical protein CA599_31310 [Paenibacillus taichungensis]
MGAPGCSILPDADKKDSLGRPGCELPRWALWSCADLVRIGESSSVPVAWFHSETASLGFWMLVDRLGLVGYKKVSWAVLGTMLLSSDKNKGYVEVMNNPTLMFLSCRGTRTYSH